MLVEGEVDASAWSAQTGEPRASLELTARNVRFLGGKDGGGTSMGGRMGGDMGAPQIDEEEIPF